MSATVESEQTSDGGSLRDAGRLLLNGAGLGDVRITRLLSFILLRTARLAPYDRAAPNELSSAGFVGVTLHFIADLGKHDTAVEVEFSGAELDRLREWHERFESRLQSTLAQLLGTIYESTAQSLPLEIDWLPSTLEFSKTQVAPDLLTAIAETARTEEVSVPAILRIILKASTDRASSLLREAGLGALIDVIAGSSEAPRLSQMEREARADELALGIHDYALALATVLRAAEGEFAFALFGRWGSGKTTLVSLLRPLLTTPQEFRERVGLDKGKMFADRRYEVVDHDAWKYRSPPEAWIYLYKSLADWAIARSSAFGRWLLALRVSIEKNGYWPIILALLSLGLVAVPVGTKVQLAILVGSVVGFSVLLHVATVTANVSSRVRELFVKHVRLTSHNEKLGMLALIGDDVRALIRAWTIRPVQSGERVPGTLSRLPWAPYAVVMLVSAAWALGLYETEHANTTGWLEGLSHVLVPQPWLDSLKHFLGPNEKISPPGPGGWIVWGMWTALASAMIVAPSFHFGRRPDRVLLVVDNLDRCSPREMLGVIEGIKLLLDDPAVNSRLQVLMLVDEDVLNHAIALQYKDMIEDRSASRPDEQGSSRVREEVVTEQKEKLFACYMRLARLGPADVATLVERLGGRENRLQRSKAQKQADLLSIRNLADAKDRLDWAQDSVQRAEGIVALGGRFQPIPLRDEDAPADRQPPFTVRIRMGGDPLPPMKEERKARMDENRRREQYNREEAARSDEERRREADTQLDQARVRLDAARKEFAELQQTAPSVTTAKDMVSLFKDAEMRFTDHEISSLQGLVPAYFEKLRRAASPRAVRALLFKIQLFRLLVQLRHPGQWQLLYSVSTTMDAFMAAQKIDAVVTSEEDLVAIARQVI